MKPIYVRSMLRWCVGILVSIASGGAGEYRKIDTPDLSLLSKNDIVAHIGERWKGVKRWRIEYDAFGVLPERGFGGIKGFIAVADNGRVRYDLFHYNREFRWSDDRYAQSIIINNEKLYNIRPNNRSHSEHKFKAGQNLGNGVWKDIVLSTVPVWPLTEYELEKDPYTGCPIPLYDLIKDDHCLLDDDLAIEPDSKEVCYRFRVGKKETIWISVDRIGCIMRRERYDVNSGEIVEIFRTLEARLFTPLHWLPARAVIQTFRAHENVNSHTRLNDPSSDRRIVSEVEIEISKFVINGEVVSATFEFQRLPGWIKTGLEGSFQQVAAGGEDFLEGQADFLRKYVKNRDVGNGKLKIVGVAVALVLGFSLGYVTWLLAIWLLRAG